MITEVAPVVWQVRFTLLPGAGDTGGSAVNDTTLVGVTTFTLMVVFAVAVPNLLVAVIVYSVVAAGETSCAPLMVVSPMLVMFTLSAFSTTHSSVEVCP